MNELTLPHADAATTIFNLHDYRVLGAETLSFGQRRIHIESTVDSGCPSCGVIGTRRHSGRQQRVRDIPVAGPVEVVWAKRRLFCDESSCPRRTFSESTLEIPARSRTTSRLHGALVDAVVSFRAGSDRNSHRPWGLVVVGAKSLDLGGNETAQR
ncbi:transposase [Arthrobacter stackebrandtii]|uniref:Transposase n=1 Tax=Arthrobacter stackebrandtii TaxID=272161 RepID=A0ABS4YTG2_9MICC|nr:transposase family protein [Arthrobacter stackebrandtii]MBP2412066.1 transposase [Arthrobacter stackebrandtii]